jgi:hypothetical protein
MPLSIHTHSSWLIDRFVHVSQYFRHSTNHMLGEMYTAADICFATYLAQLTTIKFDLSPFGSVRAFYEYHRSTQAFKLSHADFFAKLADIAISTPKLPTRPPTLYWYPLSPPARTVYFFVRASGIPVELRTTNLRHGEQRTPEYLQINPNGKVPALVDGDLKIYEVCSTHHTVTYTVDQQMHTSVECRHHSISGCKVRIATVSSA